MIKIDTNSWKEFNISEIFLMKNTKSIVQKDILIDSGNVPYVTASSENNGVMTYIECPDEWIDKGNCIMIGGKTLVFSYQKHDFCSNDSHNIALYLKNSKYADEIHYLFLMVVLKAALYQKYSWGDSISMKKIVNEKFFLPVDGKGNPDWVHMSKYMQKMLNKVGSSIGNMSQIKNNKESIDVRKWKKFHLYDDDLFNIDMGTKLDKVKMTELNPEVNFVGRANNNNGITTRVDKLMGVEPYEAGNMTLSLGGEYLGSCFIQPDVFYTSQNVVVLIPKWDMSFEVKQFISAMIFKESRLYYKAFVDELNRHIKTDFTFLLPVEADNKPDWKYMEQYIKNMIDVSEKVIEDFELLNIC